VELTDPWDGPRAFAEDYYSGGDRLAPGLTPNHITPVARTPVPALIPDLQTAPDADIDEDGLSVSSGVLSTSISPSLRETVGGDKIIQSLQHSTFIPPPINDEEGMDELTGPSFSIFLGHYLKYLKMLLCMPLKILDTMWASLKQNGSIKKPTHHT
jgi:hypothetical protein